MSGSDDSGELAKLRQQLETLTAMVASGFGRMGPQPAPVAAPPIQIAWLFKRYKKARRHEHSWRMMEDKLAPLVRELGSLPAVDLTPPKWETHRIKRRGQVMDYGRSKGRGPSESTLNIELGCAKVMLEWGVDNGHLSFNPLRKARRARTKGKRKTWLPEDWLERLLGFKRPSGEEQAKALRAWVLAIFDSGARYDEARRLRRDRLRKRTDDDEGVAGSSGWVVGIDQTKNRKAHVLGLTARTFEALMALDEVPGSPYFFARRATKKLWSKRTFGWWFRNACESVEIDVVVAEGEVRVRPHDGRRSAATNAHNRGASLLQIQAMLNHSSPAITAHYVQVNETNAVAVAKIMEDGAARDRARKPPKRAHLFPVDGTGKTVVTSR